MEKWKKNLYETIMGQKVWAEWDVCKKCGERGINIKEYRRVDELLHPPFEKNQFASLISCRSFQENNIIRQKMSPIISDPNENDFF
jgi:hypothetical protein